MKKFLFLTAICLLPATSYAEVIAKYNGIPVTREEVEKSLAQMAPMGADAAKLSKMPADFQKNFVEKYIENKLIIDAARKAGVHRQPEIVAKMKEAETYLIQQKYMTDLVGKQMTDASLKKLYDEKYKGKDGEQEIKAYHILVKSEDEAKALKKEIDGGKNFENLAKEKSVDPGAKVSGGDLGFFTYEQMVPEFSKVAFATKPGTVSDPVKTPFGWHLIKVIGRKNKELPSFEDSKETLENEMARKVIEEKITALRKQSNIVYLGDMAKIANPPKPLEPAKPKVVSIAPKKDAKPTPAKAATAVKASPTTKPSVKMVKDTAKKDGE